MFQPGPRAALVADGFLNELRVRVEQRQHGKPQTTEPRQRGAWKNVSQWRKKQTLRRAGGSVNFPPDMGRLTTHALDLIRGTPARGLDIELWRLNAEAAPQWLKTARTNADGRTDEPLLAPDGICAGRV